MKVCRWCRTAEDKMPVRTSGRYCCELMRVSCSTGVVRDNYLIESTDPIPEDGLSMVPGAVPGGVRLQCCNCLADVTANPDTHKCVSKSPAVLSDEEVWLRVYCAGVACPERIKVSETADIALETFRRRFRK